jgi:predicted nucleotide-binding protein
MEPKERLAAVRAIGTFLLPQSEVEVDMSLRAAGSEEVVPEGWDRRNEGERRDQILRLLSGLADSILESLLQMLSGNKRITEITPTSTMAIPGISSVAEAVGTVSQLEEASPAKSIGLVGPGDKRSVFLVHGRDVRAAREMRTLLRALGLHIIEWENAVRETRQATPYIGDVIFAGMRVADAVIVLMTPDDLVCLRPDLLSSDDSANERELRGQARANVIYEAGIADALDRSRTVLVELGGVKSLSDLSGRNVVRFDGSAMSRHKLVSRLEGAGLKPDTRGDDWLEVGNFDVAKEAALHDASPSIRRISYSRAQQSARPRVLVGSSSECEGPAVATKRILEDNETLSVIYWKDLLATAGTQIIEMLGQGDEKQFHFAVFILSQDDMLAFRGNSSSASRYNFLFEMALVIGALGRENVFLIVPDKGGLKLPSDLGGVRVGKWVTGESNIEAAVRSTASSYRSMMENIWRQETKANGQVGGRFAGS